MGVGMPAVRIVLVATCAIRPVMVITHRAIGVMIVRGMVPVVVNVGM